MTATDAGRPDHVFRFPLQRVLDLRERQQRDAATALATANAAADAARRAEDALVAARADLAAAGAAPSGEGSAVGAMRTTALLVAHLDAQARTARAATQAAHAVVNDREDALRSAYRDRRALDRLRERHQAAWQTGAVAADRQQMDEVALTRFTQRVVRVSAAD